MSNHSSSAQSEISLTYKFLLILSTTSAVFFCWLYVNKPAVIVYAESNESTELASTTEAPIEQDAEANLGFDTLSSQPLPGENIEGNPSQENTVIIANATNTPLSQSPSASDDSAWEETNDRIQHVLTAESAGQSQRVLLEIPVIYQTRGLRLDPSKAKEAQRVLRALKIYQQQIKKLHQDGKNIQNAWNSILMDAQPIEALRADSPSLPQQALNSQGMLQQNSSETIQLSK